MYIRMMAVAALWILLSGICEAQQYQDILEVINDAILPEYRHHISTTNIEYNHIFKDDEDGDLTIEGPVIKRYMSAFLGVSDARYDGMLQQVDMSLRKNGLEKVYQSEDKHKSVYTNYKRGKKLIFVETYFPPLDTRRIEVTIYEARFFDKVASIEQDYIYNTSFEALDQHRSNIPFKYELQIDAKIDHLGYWKDCGQFLFVETNGFDIYWSDTPLCDIIGNPTDGNTCLGLVSRNDDSWESLGQQLKKPLDAGCYEAKIDVRMIDSISCEMSRDISHPSTLAIYLGNDLCMPDTLVYQSSDIKNTDWQTLNVTFGTTRPYKYMMFAVHPYRDTVKQDAYLFIDNLRDINKVSCME